jgi:hypothetical protein
MRIFPSIFIGALLVLAAPVIAGETGKARAEAKLAKALEGRVPGKPVRCLYLRDIRSSEIIDGTAILYRTNGNKLYVNRPEMGQNSLHRNDVLVTNTHSSQLCSIDIVRLYDTGSRMQKGSVGLGEFVPYTKPAKGG